MFIGALYLRPKGVFTRWDVWYVGRCLIATAVMVPVVILFSRIANVGLFASMIYGAITYATVAYTLKLVRDDDILSLVSIVTSRVGVQLPFKGQTGTFARIPVVGADPSESLENPLHTTTEWAAAAALLAGWPPPPARRCSPARTGSTSSIPTTTWTTPLCTRPSQCTSRPAPRASQFPACAPPACANSKGIKGIHIIPTSYGHVTSVSAPFLIGAITV